MSAHTHDDVDRLTFGCQGCIDNAVADEARGWWNSLGCEEMDRWELAELLDGADESNEEWARSRACGEFLMLVDDRLEALAEADLP